MLYFKCVDVRSINFVYSYLFISLFDLSPYQPWGFVVSMVDCVCMNIITIFCLGIIVGYLIRDLTNKKYGRK